MLGRFGIVLILLAVLLCTGVLSGNSAFKLNADAAVIPGAVIMVAAVLLAAFAEKITANLPEEKQRPATLFIKLGAVILCGVGAIAVFCG